MFAIQRHRSTYVKSIRSINRDKRRMQLREKVILAEAEIALLRQNHWKSYHCKADTDERTDNRRQILIKSEALWRGEMCFNENHKRKDQ